MLKAGIIGAGAIAESGIEGFRESGACEVAAIGDLNRERAEELAKNRGIGSVYTNNTELINDKSIDLVYIAVPNAFHAPLAIEALEAGKHVILEKPFATSIEDAEKVIETANKSGKLFTVGMNQRFTPEAQKMRRAVEDNRLGEIYHASAYWYRRAGIPRLGTWFGKKSLAGGGCLYDIGVHLLDLCLYVIGSFEPATVTGFAHSMFGKRGLGEGGWGKSDREEIPFDVDDFSGALIRMKDGKVVELNVSWARHQSEAGPMGVEVFGAEAGLSVMKNEIYRFGNPDGTGPYVVEQGCDYKLYHEHCNRFVNFVGAVEGKEDLHVTPEQALNVQKILSTLYKSAEEGREISL